MKYSTGIALGLAATATAADLRPPTPTTGGHTSNRHIAQHNHAAAPGVSVNSRSSSHPASGSGTNSNAGPYSNTGTSPYSKTGPYCKTGNANANGDGDGDALEKRKGAGKFAALYAISDLAANSNQAPAAGGRNAAVRAGVVAAGVVGVGLGSGLL